MKIQVDGVETYYETPRGFPCGPENLAALFVHGAGGSSQHWQRLLPHLSGTIYPLLVDLPGGGRSGGFVPDTVEDAARFLEHFLAQLCITDPLICVGHSLGGLIFQQFSLCHPERVALLVLIATASRVRTHPDFLQSVLTGTWDLERLRASFGSSVPLEVQDPVLQELTKARVPSGATEFMNVGDLDLGKEVSALSMPTLIIAGSNDVIISPRHSRTLARSIQHATLLIVPGAGHYVQVEQPEQVAAILNSFIEHNKSTVP